MVDELQSILDRPEPHYSEPPEVRAPHVLAGRAYMSALRLFEDGARRTGPFARLRERRRRGANPPSRQEKSHG